MRVSISGLAITLSADDELAVAALQALRARPEIEVGPRASNRVAITTDTSGDRADRDLFHWISALPGVVHADVVSVWFDDAAGAARPQRGASP